MLDKIMFNEERGYKQSQCRSSRSVLTTRCASSNRWRKRERERDYNDPNSGSAKRLKGKKKIKTLHMKFRDSSRILSM